RPLDRAGDGGRLPLAEREEHEVPRVADRAEPLRQTVSRHLIDRVEEARVVFARLPRERLDPSARGEGGSRLVESDVAIGADAQQLHVDAARVADRGVVTLAGALE